MNLLVFFVLTFGVMHFVDKKEYGMGALWALLALGLAISDGIGRIIEALKP